MAEDRRNIFAQADSDLGTPEAAFKLPFDTGPREIVPVETRNFALSVPVSVKMVRADDNMFDYLGEKVIVAASEDTIEEMPEDTYLFNTLDDIFKNKSGLAAEYFSKNPSLLFELIDGNPELLSALAEIVAERQAK